MNRDKKEVVEFLTSTGMEYSNIDIDANVRIFLAEMEKGLRGVHSSLEMLPTYIEVDKPIPINERVIVLDAGGTNFRVASFYFNTEKKPVIEKYKKYSMPGMKREVSKEEFFNIIAQYIEEVIGDSKRIGFCFSYPTHMLPNKDGIPIQFSKEIKAEEVIGELVGENLASAVRLRGFRAPERTVILNDTVATLLAGQSVFQNRSFDSYVGFILGTGTNCCYIEKNGNIVKEPDLDPARNQIVNIESGGFGRAPRGVIDRQYDKSMKNPGEYTFEKMISGAYFGSLCLTTIQKAGESGLISGSVKREIDQVSFLDTKDVNDYLLFQESEKNSLALALGRGSEHDRLRVYYIIDRLIERAAKLTAIHLSAVVLKTEKGKNPHHPICITAEGSTFYGLKFLKERIGFYLKEYLVDKKERFYEFVNVENATLIGAAIAGLTN